MKEKSEFEKIQDDLRGGEVKGRSIMSTDLVNLKYISAIYSPSGDGSDMAFSSRKINGKKFEILQPLPIFIREFVHDCFESNYQDDDYRKDLSVIVEYAKILTLPITKSLFVPCDENDVPIVWQKMRIPESEDEAALQTDIAIRYDQAEKKVLFDGVIISLVSDFYSVEVLRKGSDNDYQWCGSWDNFISSYLSQGIMVDSLTRLNGGGSLQIKLNRNFLNRIGL